MFEDYYNSAQQRLANIPYGYAAHIYNKTRYSLAHRNEVVSPFSKFVSNFTSVGGLISTGLLGTQLGFDARYTMFAKKMSFNDMLVSHYMRSGKYTSKEIEAMVGPINKGTSRLIDKTLFRGKYLGESVVEGQKAKAAFELYNEGKITSSYARNIISKSAKATRLGSKANFLISSIASYAEEHMKGHSQFLSISKGAAKGAVAVGAWELAQSAFAGTMAATGWSGPLGWAASAGVAAATYFAVETFGDEAVDMFMAPMAKIEGAIENTSFYAIGKKQRQLNIGRANQITRNPLGDTLRERSIMMAARHGLNARFEMGNEAAIWHK